MARYYGKIGFATQLETSPGIWTDDITERRYTGNVVQETHRWKPNEYINDDFTVNNQISIVADVYAFTNFPSIRYVSWMGTKWRIKSVEIKRPRIVITIGGLYNG